MTKGVQQRTDRAMRFGGGILPAFHRLPDGLFDAHVHLQDPRFAGQLRERLDEAVGLGVRHWGVCGTSPEDWAAVESLGASVPGVVMAFGVHPWFVRDLPDDGLERLDGLLRRHPRAAVGEIGLDGRHDRASRDRQQAWFDAQLALAARLGRMVVLHAVRSLPDVLHRLRPWATRLPGFLLHRFDGTSEHWAMAERMGGYASLGGSLLNPRAQRTQTAARAVAPDRLLVETDAPDGCFPGGWGCAGNDRLNHPANLGRVVEGLARRLGRDPLDVGAMTARNARGVWGLDV